MPADVLGRIPLFAGLGPAELRELEEAMRPQTFAAGDVICREGEPGDSLFVVVEGFARVMLHDRDVARLRRGDVIGEMSLVSGEPRSATVVAAVPTTALELSREDVASLIARRPQILENLTRILSGRLAATTARVGETSRGEAVALLVGEQGTVVVVADAGQENVVEAADRTVSVEGGEDIAWLGRHLSRTKLGLALGAGGAKG